MTTLPQPPALDAMASGKPVALFLDFDGTLVEIAPTPDGIDVPPGLAASLQDLAAQVDNRLALVSGRAISDIEGFTGPLRIARAGSHGVDMRLPDDTPLASAPEPFPRGALAQLAEFAGDKGFALEEKPHGAALHYRANPALENCGVEFAGTIARHHGLVLKRGKCVVELVHPGAEKGAAVRAFMQHPLFAGSHPVFIGDDVTDEDGFTAVAEYGGTGILVGDRYHTKAQYRLADPASVLAWLGVSR